MRMTQLFSQTLRDAPGDTDVVSHQLLLRAGFIRPLAAGIFSYLPLARADDDQNRDHHPAGDGCHRRAGDHHAGGASGGFVAGDETLVSDRLGAGALPRPGRARHGAGDDSRRSHRRLGAQRNPFLSPTSAAGLSASDQMARRTPSARRIDPRARVHDEGQLQPRRRLGRAGQAVSGALFAPISASTAAVDCRPSRSSRTPA